jgi:sterol carrier protein 2
MAVKARVAGVGMIPFTKPGQSEDWDVMAEKAIRLALKDAGVDYALIQQAYAGYVYGDSTSGQSAIYRVGCTGIPIVNVNNTCASGSTALYLARQMIELGAADCVLAVGFEQMVPGALGQAFKDRKRTLDAIIAAQDRIEAADPSAPLAARPYGGAAVEYLEKYGAKPETFAQISVKARRHAANNPLAIFRDPVTLVEVMASKQIAGPVTRLQACPPTCGAAAAILVSPAFARKHRLRADVEIVAQSMTTDTAVTFESNSMLQIIGYDMAKAAARLVYEASGIGPDDVQVVELHDCFTPNELVSYETLGFCPEGGAEKFIWDGDNTYGGKVVTNPSGGLLSKGHPLGATGLAQCYELTQQLRGAADKRQVEGVTYALQHNMGMGGACVVTLYGHA